MKFGSLFSGISGFDLGFERAGFECAWQVEIDDNCQKLLEMRFPHAKRYTDIRTVKPRKLEPVDLVCGGFPCQDLSVAGKRAGLAGERSGLWFEFHRIVKATHPRWVVIENVPGLLSSNDGRDFAVILRGLVECGYGVAWRILDAQYFGVPQRRRRVFVVASLGNGRCAEVLFEPEGGAGDPAESGETRARVAAPLTRGTSSGRGVNPPGRRQEDDVNLVAYTLPASGRHTGDGHGNAWNSNYVAFGGNNTSGEIDTATACNAHGGSGRLDNGNVSGTLQSKKNGGYSLNYQNTIAFAWQQGDDSKFNESGRGRSYIARAGDYTGALSETRQDAIAFDLAQITSPQNRVRCELDSPSPTMNGTSQMRAAGSSGVRRLTPTECERLQGFPDRWTEGFSDSIRYRMLGNAVAVPCAEWLARRIPQ